MIIEIGTDISNLPNEEGAHLIRELLFVFMRRQNGSTCNVQEILPYFEETVVPTFLEQNEVRLTSRSSPFSLCFPTFTFSFDDITITMTYTTLDAEIHNFRREENFYNEIIHA